MNKRFWRCIVCNDIHFGLNPPEICPTCGQVNRYIEVEAKEVLKILKGLGYESK
ncbi:MAG: hypothetical protein QXY45_04070 [Candidatus Aenigmatarchaeota archaeon]